MGCAYVGARGGFFLGKKSVFAVSPRCLRRRVNAAAAERVAVERVVASLLIAHLVVASPNTLDNVVLTGGYRVKIALISP